MSGSATVAGVDKRFRAAMALRMRGALAMATALILVACGQDEPLPNIAPFAYEDFARTRHQVPVDVDVLTNDIDVDGGTLTAELISTPHDAVAQIVGGNRVRITPAAGFIGRIEVQYVARDARGAASAPTRVVVDVAPAARAFVSAFDGAQTQWYLADTASSQLLLTSAGAPGAVPFALSSDGSTLVLLHCVAALHCSVLSSPVRSRPMTAPAVLLADAALEPALVVSADGRRVVVVQRVDDPSLPRGWKFELLSIDTSNGDIVQRLGLPRVDELSSIRGAGDAQKIFVGQRISYSGTRFWVGDLAAGVVTEVTYFYPFLSDYCGAIFCMRPYSWNFSNDPISDDGRFIVFQYSGILFMVDAEHPARMIALTPVRPLPLRSDSVRIPLAFVPGTTDLIAGDVPNHDAPGCPCTPENIQRTLWRMPLPDASGSLSIRGQSPGTTSRRVAVRKDGQRLVDSSNEYGSPYSQLLEIGTTDGAIFGELSPAGGVYGLQEFRYLGNGADLLVLSLDPPSFKTLNIIRSGAPGSMETFGRDRIYSDIMSFDADSAGTTVGFTLAEMENGVSVARAYLAEVNAPATSVPLAVPTATYVFLQRVLDAPLP